jgi:hypothetical protein
MTFIKGQSGNPAGRPKSKVAAVNLRQSIADNIHEVIDMLFARALSCGDTAAAKILLDRVMPPLKPMDAPITIEAMEGDNHLSVSNRVFNMMLSGELSPEQAIRAMTAVVDLSSVVEVQNKADSKAEDKAFLELIKKAGR